MPTILGCIRDQHNWPLLLLAAAVCALACWTACLIYHRMLASRRSRVFYLLLTALTAGGGIWATHFIAMLAYAPGVATSYDPALTLASALLVIVIAGLSFRLRGASRGFAGRAMAGALLGLGTGAMHFLGIGALHIPGVVTIDIPMAAAAVAIGAIFFALAFNPPARRSLAMPWTTSLLMLGILSLHLTGMSAVRLLLGEDAPTPSQGLEREEIAIIAAFATAALLALLVWALFQTHLALRQARVAEHNRLRDLADAAFEGVAICDSALVLLDMNQHLRNLLGRPAAKTLGRPLGDMLRTEDGRGVSAMLEAAAQTPITAMLAGAQGMVPVELRSRQIETAAGRRVVAAVRDLRDRLATEARMRHLAYHDVLTGVANRATLQVRLRQATAQARQGHGGFALLCLDLDRFKEINDLYGHAAGDRLLQAAVERCRAEIRQGDVMARLGGDEFVILQMDATAPEQAGDLARRLLARLSEPFVLPGERQVCISASIGIALCPRDADDPERLLANADMALRRVKRAGRRDHAFYSRGMDEEARETRALLADLRQALARQELRLVYQPQAKAVTGAIVGFEALVRWQHPLRGQIPPGVFIPLAEEAGIIHEIGAWVREAACAEAASWTKPLRISLNTSAAELRRPDFLDSISAVLTATGLDPARLEIEITESLLIGDTGQALATLNAIRALGIQVAIDDFGTGYSSLSTLRAFPFTRIKIDRSFVRDLGSNTQSLAIVRAVIGLGRGLGIPVIAEGVETVTQMATLAAEGCNELQGYLHGKPAPIERYRTLVHGEQPAPARASRESVQES